MYYVHSFDFLLNPLFGYFYCLKVAFDNNYNMLIDWTNIRFELKSAVHKPAFRAFKQI